jgi:mono/diheme cytochrome c family protein
MRLLSKVRSSVSTHFPCFLLAGLVLLTLGCNEISGRWSSSQDAFLPLSFQEASTEMNYSYVKSSILDKYCTSCHGNDGGVNLENVSGIRAHARDILSDISSHRMPKEGNGDPAMSDSDRRILYDWVKAGAPEGSTAVVPSYPPLSDADAAEKLNYAYVQKQILIPYCMVCHRETEGAGKISVESLDQIRAHSSAIMNAIAVTKKMPLGNAAKGMTEDDRSVLYNWLLAGAPQGTAAVPSPFDIHFPPLSDSDTQSKLNYPYIRDQILIPKCISCHGASGHLSLETLPAVQKSTKKILFAVFSIAPTMPPFGLLKPGWNSITQPLPDPVPPHRDLTDNDQQVFYAWLSAGAPAGVSTVVDPPLVQPNFTDIDQRIFQVRCMDCHSPSTKLGKEIPLTKQGLLNPQDNLVVPGHPEQSRLMLSLEQVSTNDPDSDPVPMPPIKKGYAKLPAGELKAIQDWISSGAKD